MSPFLKFDDDMFYSRFLESCISLETKIQLLHKSQHFRVFDVINGKELLCYRYSKKIVWARISNMQIIEIIARDYYPPRFQN